MSGKEGNVVVIVHVNKEYEDVANVFTYLFKHNWPDCPYHVVYSFKGRTFGNYGFDEYVSPTTDSLTTDIYNIMKKNNCDYCVSFLGDALITEPIENAKITNIFHQLRDKNIDYCRLYHSANNVKHLERIKKNEIYGISFISFICSNDFVEKEFHNTTDLKFEQKYLAIARSSDKNSGEFQKAWALPNSMFHIEHGIVKGKWVRKVYKKIKCMNIQISGGGYRMTACLFQRQ